MRRCDVCLSISVYLPNWFSLMVVFQQETSLTGVMVLSQFTDVFAYQRGKCTFSGQSMPTTDGDVYNLRINPAENLAGNNLFAGPSLTIR